ncbi:28362_t:CDS:1, partial [Gigaspora margarita]
LQKKLKGALPNTYKEKSIARKEYNLNKENLFKVEPSTNTCQGNRKEGNYRKQ